MTSPAGFTAGRVFDKPRQRVRRVRTVWIFYQTDASHARAGGPDNVAPARRFKTCHPRARGQPFEKSRRRDFVPHAATRARATSQNIPTSGGFKPRGHARAGGIYEPRFIFARNQCHSLARGRDWMKQCLYYQHCVPSTRGRAGSGAGLLSSPRLGAINAPAGAPSANGLDFFPARYWLPRGHARAGVL